MCVYFVKGFNVVVAGCFFVVELVLWLSFVELFLFLTNTIFMVIFSVVMVFVLLEIGLGFELVFVVLLYDFRFFSGIVFVNFF